MPLPAIVPWIPAIVAGVQGLASYFGGKKDKPKLAEDTFTGRYLAQIAERGAISPKQRSRLLSREGMRAGNLASKSRARTRGALSAGGMDQSIAGIRSIEESGHRAESQLAGFGERLDIAQEQSKGEAAKALRQAKDQSRAVKRNWQASQFSGILNSIADTAVASAGAYSDIAVLNPLLERLDAALASGDWEGATAAIDAFLAMKGTRGGE